MLVQRIKKSCIIPLRCIRPTDHNHIDAPECFLVVAEALTDYPFDSVPHHGGTGRLTGYSQTKAREIQRIRASQHREARIGRFLGPGENMLEISFAG